MMTDIAGQRFGRLVAVAPTEKRSHGCIVWIFKCDCGSTFEAQPRAMKAGRSKSCGCLFRETRKKAAFAASGSKMKQNIDNYMSRFEADDSDDND